jgi:RNA exonuclease 4
MDVSKLSSNWKILQGRLTATNKSNAELASRTLKRKSSETADEDDNSNKAKRWKENSQNKARRQADMNNGTTKPRSKSLVDTTRSPVETPTRPSTSHSNHEPDLETQENEGVSSTAMAGKYIGLDCEMVGVGPTPDQDSQLARVSLVNFHGEQIYDTYVKPQLPVTDYRTAVSGIRPENLTVGRPFKEVQKDVITFLQGRILVGHYLKSDVTILQIKHPKKDIRDSSKLPKFRELVGGRAPKLKVLAQKVLGLDIQGGEHNSVEDARAAMMLYKAEKEAFEAESKKLFPSTNKPKVGSPAPKKKKKSKKKRN